MLYWLKVHLRGFIMVLHLVWLIPAAIFALLCYREPRSLFNAYLLTFTLMMMGIVLAGLTIVSLERFIGYTPAIILFLAIPFSVFASTVYLLFNGRKMVQLEGLRLANLLSLLYGLAIVGVGLLHFFAPRSFLATLISLADLLLFYGTFLYLSYIIYAFFLNIFPIKKEPQTIIILGAGLFGDKVPPLLAQRLDKGIAIYEKFNRKPVIIVSGGQGDDEWISEAEAMAGYLMEKGVPADSIFLENKSRTTLENLIFSKELMLAQGLEQDRVVLVTNSFHALRAGIYMKQVGLKGRSIGSRTAFYFLPSAWIRETAGLIRIYWKWHAFIIGILLLPFLFSLFHTYFSL